MSQVNKDFLRQVFNNEKRLFKKKEVEYVHVSHFEELSVKHLWKDLSKDPVFILYFQDEYPKERYPARSYFFDILNTLYPEYLQRVLSHASTQRNSASGEANQVHKITISDAWFEELNKMPFKSCKCDHFFIPNFIHAVAKRGKTLHLLKANAKKISSQKQRKVIPLLGSIQEFQKMQLSQSQSQHSQSQSQHSQSQAQQPSQSNDDGMENEERNNKDSTEGKKPVIF